MYEGPPYLLFGWQELPETAQMMQYLNLDLDPESALFREIEQELEDPDSLRSKIKANIKDTFTLIECVRRHPATSDHADGDERQARREFGYDVEPLLDEAGNPIERIPLDDDPGDVRDDSDSDASD